jgi:hypothetical protein
MTENKMLIVAFNIEYIPTTYFIDKDGRIRNVKVGAFLSEAEIANSILGSIIQGDLGGR